DACLRSKWLKTWDFDCEHAIGGVRSTNPPPPALSSSSEPLAKDGAGKEEKAEPAEVSAASGSASAGDVDDTVPLDAEIDGGAPVPEIGEAYAMLFDAEKQPEEETSGDVDVDQQQTFVQPKFEDPTAVKASGLASPVRAPESVAANLGEKPKQPATGANDQPEANDDGRSQADVADNNKHVEL
ncbi:hypothetical protein LPJ56_007075, partial [Coemansia sp. RSA 2599]